MGIKRYIREKVLNNSVYSIYDEQLFPTHLFKVKKNEIITRFGQIEQKAYFLVKGITESAVLKDGEFRIIDFTFPGNFVCSYTSFLFQIPSDIQIRAITDCEIEFFYKNDLEEAYKTSLTANRFGRYVTEQFFLSKLKKERDFLTKTARERYIELIEEHPEVIHNIPVNKIAKYLGILPESLSRIRKDIF